MRIAAGVMLLVVLVLAWLLSTEMMTSREQRDHIQKLTASLADKSKQENLELQSKCALQAEKMFRKMPSARLPSVSSAKQEISYDFESHYNVKLNKCFMLHTTYYENGTASYNLFDAYELRDYASFIGQIDKGQKIIHLCLLTPSLGNEQICKSEEEYKAFVVQYME